MPRLTKRLCQSAPEGTIWDSELPGFGLRVQASGRRSFIIRYRTARGTDRLFTIGSLAEIDPETARELARQAKVAARAGNDPRQDRSAARHAPRLEDLRDRMQDEHSSQKRPATEKAYADAWRLYILPTLGNVAVADITDTDVLKLRKSLSHIPTTANRAMAVLRKALNLAERWLWRTVGSNPCKWVDHYPENARERVLTDDEISRVWREMDGPLLLESSRAFFKLLILTGLRRSEWRLAIWGWLDETNACLRIPEHGSKTGARIVPLAPEVMAILSGLPRSSVYILPGKTGGPLNGEQKTWRTICKRAGVSGARIHDLRHTVGSHAHAAGATQREIAELLGHRQLVTTERYINSTGKGRANVNRATATILSMAQKKTG